MRAITDVSAEILGGNPKPFYVLCGSEYGVKAEYISALSHHYGGCAEYDKMSDLMSFFMTKHLIEPDPTLYIVRYDAEFIKLLDESTAKLIGDLKIIGTIICIYDDKKHESVLSTYLGEYTVSVSAMHPKFMRLHLKERFSERLSGFIDSMDLDGISYGEAVNVLSSVEHLPDIENIESSDLMPILSRDRLYTIEDFSSAFLHKDFRSCSKILDRYLGSLHDLYYAMLNALTVAESAVSKADRGYSSGYDKSIPHIWNIRDLVCVFQLVYAELMASRTSEYYDIYASLLYLIEMSIQRYEL